MLYGRNRIIVEGFFCVAFTLMTCTCSSYAQLIHLDQVSPPDVSVVLSDEELSQKVRVFCEKVLYEKVIAITPGKTGSHQFQPMKYFEVTIENATRPSYVEVFAKTGMVLSYSNSSGIHGGVEERRAVNIDFIPEYLQDWKPIYEGYTAEETFEAIGALLDYYEQPKELDLYTEMTYINPYKWNFNWEFETDGVPFLNTGLYFTVSGTTRRVKWLRYKPIPVIPPKIEVMFNEQEAAQMAEESLRWEVLKSSIVKAESETKWIPVAKQDSNGDNIPVVKKGAVVQKNRLVLSGLKLNPSILLDTKNISQVIVFPELYADYSYHSTDMKNMKEHFTNKSKNIEPEPRVCWLIPFNRRPVLTEHEVVFDHQYWVFVDVETGEAIRWDGVITIRDSEYWKTLLPYIIFFILFLFGVLYIFRMSINLKSLENKELINKTVISKIK